MAKQSRWRSKVLWAAVAAQAIVLLRVLGLWAIWGVDEGIVSDAVAAALQLLALVGVINDPTNGTGW